MRQFKVIVNGKEYHVEVDEITKAVSEMQVAEEKVKVEMVQAKVDDPQQAGPPTSVSGDSKTITAPLAGTILSVRVQTGDHVKAGDIVLTLEALKLENEIITPHSGVVGSVAATVGQNVNAGDILVVIDEI